MVEVGLSSHITIGPHSQELGQNDIVGHYYFRFEIKDKTLQQIANNNPNQHLYFIVTINSVNSVYKQFNILQFTDVFVSNLKSLKVVRLYYFLNDQQQSYRNLLYQVIDPNS